MDLQPDKTDGVIRPITTTSISASEWNQLVGSCMEFITEAGFTPDAEDNAQFLNAFKAIAAGLEIVGANTNLSNLTSTGEAHFAKPDLSNATAVHIVETYHSGTEWYRVYSDGWCEQGGFVQGTNNYRKQITFLKAFADTNYTVLFGTQYTTSMQDNPLVETSTKATSGFTLISSNNTNVSTYWEAKGYIS